MSGPHEDPDVVAMSRLRGGDDLALNEIMDRWQRRLTSYLIRLTGSETVAIDLAQETFVRVYQNRVRVPSDGRVLNVALCHSLQSRTTPYSLEAAASRDFHRCPGGHTTFHLGNPSGLRPRSTGASRKG